jgi:hypothetical protein
MLRIQRQGIAWSGLVIACLMANAIAPPPPAQAYIINPLPTLGYTTSESTYILLVRVEKVSREKGVIIYHKVRDLAWKKYPEDTLKHAFNLKDRPAVAGQLFRPEANDWSYILQWAEPGKEAVIFIRKENNGGDCGHTYIDQCWYSNSSAANDGVWFHTLHTSPELLRKYFCGSPARLATAVEAMVAQGGNRDGNPVVPTLQEGSIAELRAGKGKIRGLRVGCARNDFNLKRDTAAWDDPKGVAVFVKALGEKDQTVRLQAVKELEHWFGPEVQAALPALTAALKHDDMATRRVAAAALGNYHLDASRAVPALCEALKDKDLELAVQASEALCALREKGNAAIPALREAMKVEGVRGESAAAALISINLDIEAEVPAVTEALRKRGSVGGKYRNLLERIKAPQDLDARQFFRDQAAIVGVSPPVPEYRGRKNIASGYWVYVYPYWYVWGEQSAPK